MTTNGLIALPFTLPWPARIYWPAAPRVPVAHTLASAARNRGVAPPVLSQTMFPGITVTYTPRGPCARFMGC